MKETNNQNKMKLVNTTTTTALIATSLVANILPSQADELNIENNLIFKMAAEDGNTCRAASVAFISVFTAKAKYGSKTVSESVMNSASEFLNASCTSKEMQDKMMQAVVASPKTFSNERIVDVSVDYIDLIKVARYRGLPNVKALFN
jgi:hypothetical protein